MDETIILKLLSPLFPKPKYDPQKMIKFLDSTFADIYLDDVKSPKVVIKVFKKDKFDVSSIAREREIMRVLQAQELVKEHIPQILEYKKHKQFALSYCGADGIDLINAGKFDFDMWLECVAQLTPVVGKIHEAGFVHCDLKPENVTYNNGKWHIIDFGLSKRISGGQYNKLQGTYPYFSPILTNDLVASRFRQNNWDLPVLVYGEYYTWALTLLSLFGYIYGHNGRTFTLDIGLLKKMYQGNLDGLVPPPGFGGHPHHNLGGGLVKILAGILLTQVIPESNLVEWEPNHAMASFLKFDNCTMVGARWPTKVKPLWDELHEKIYNYKHDNV